MVKPPIFGRFSGALFEGELEAVYGRLYKVVPSIFPHDPPSFVTRGRTVFFCAYRHFVQLSGRDETNTKIMINSIIDDSSI
jgi:hypothetical protein